MAAGLDEWVNTSPFGSTEVPHPSYKGKLVAIMNFAEVVTQENCEAFLKDFSSESEAVCFYCLCWTLGSSFSPPCFATENPCQSLLILVDIRTVGARRLNSLRQIIDDCGEAMRFRHVDALNKSLVAAAVRARLRVRVHTYLCLSNSLYVCLCPFPHTLVLLCFLCLGAFLAFSGVSFRGRSRCIVPSFSVHCAQCDL